MSSVVSVSASGTTTSGFGAGEWATLGAALIAAAIAVIGYCVTQARARRERRAKAFAEALAAVEDYMESPYRIRRRPRSDADTRTQITAAISDIQSRIAFHEAWLEVEAPKVGAAFARLVRVARGEAGANMKEAWAEPVLEDDRAMNLGMRYNRSQTEAVRGEVLTVMKAHLRGYPFLWWRRLSSSGSTSALAPAPGAVGERS